MLFGARMNPPDVQSDPEPEYFDPEEEVDMSEQQFLASLETARPEFVLDEAAVGCPAAEVLRQPASRSNEAIRPEERQETMGSESLPAASSGNGGSEVAEKDSKPIAAGATEDDWRSLVSAKVNKYKSRNPQADRYPSLKLPFEPVPLPVGPSAPAFRKNLQSTEPQMCAAAEENAPKVAVEAPQAIAVPILAPGARIVLETSARVLEFPKPASLWDDALAEPVMDRPRIVEAPELVPAPPAMGGILIESPAEPERERQLGFDMPLQATPLGRRAMAAVADGVIVSSALALFAYVFFHMTQGAVAFRILAPWTVAVLAMLWAGYQYAFLVFTKTTPGLLVTRLQVTRFDGSYPKRQLLRWRALASMLSCAALGLGYAWCWFDEDQLSWHDRVTRTHLAAKAPRN